MMGPFLMMIGAILLWSAMQGKSFDLLNALDVPIPSVDKRVSDFITAFATMIWKSFPFKLPFTN